MRAVDVLFEVLRSEGVSRIFGNPGSTEMPLMDALYGQSEFSYTLGLQEATVVGMADGYAQATNRASFVNLHTAGGIGHAMGTIVGSKLTRTPMVITAGNQDTRHFAKEPWLSGDLVSMAKPCVKWATEVQRAEDVGHIMRRAFAIANAHPRGPVFVSLPMNIMLQEVQSPPPKKNASITSGAADIAALATLIESTARTKIAVLLSDMILHTQAAEAALNLANALGGSIYGTPLLARNVFPITHPAWRGVLPPDFKIIHEKLQAYDLIIMVGDHEMLAYLYREMGPFPQSSRLAQISNHAGAMGQDGSVDFALVGDISKTLTLLGQQITSVASNTSLTSATDQLIEAKSQQMPLHPTVAVRAILANVPQDTQIINESSGTYDTTREQWRNAIIGNYYFVRSGNLGWGMPAAVGVALANPHQTTLCFVGDGASMYSPQAIWSAVRYNANVCFIVFNNQRYDILMRVAKSLGFANANAERFVEMKFEDPPINFAGLAQTFGVTYSVATTESEIAGALRLLLASPQTCLLEIKTSGL